MNIEDFREYCLSFSGATEKFPFGKATSEYDRNLLVFCVADKWFCFVNVDIFDFCTIRCATDDIGELQALYDDVRPAYHMNKQHWISVRFNRELHDQKVKELVKNSYEILVKSLTRREREALDATPPPAHCGHTP